MNKNILKGKKIGITAYDLQQKEHRGIAAYTKNLIKVLSENNAEVYLITNIGSQRIKRSRNRAFYEEVSVADILNLLQKGTLSYGESNIRGKIAFLIKYPIKSFINTLILLINRFKLKYQFIKINDLQKKIHISEFKFDYLNYISGIIVVGGIFNLSIFRSMRYIFRIPQLNIRKNKLDLIITSCPVCIKSKKNNYAPIVQIIHDAIPIQDPDHTRPKAFLNTLKDAHSNKCLYVSSATQNIVCDLLQISKFKNELDILRPLPSISIEILNDSLNINSILDISKPFVLLNCSIVSWKKIEKSINFFNQSNLTDRGFCFVLLGKFTIQNIVNTLKNYVLRTKIFSF